MRLRGLGLGRGGMKKLKNLHKGGVVRVLCKFRTTQYVVRVLCENFAFLRFSKTESMVLKFCHKNEFAQGSHSCEIRTEILGRDREHAFFENWHKSKFAQGMCCAKISPNRKCCAKIAESWFFSLVFPCFHHNFILQAFLLVC